MEHCNGSDLIRTLAEGFSSEQLSMIFLQSTIAAEISIHRVKLGMSQKEFAKKMKVSQSTVSKWESGETNFTLSTLAHIAELLNIEIQSVFKPTPPAVPASSPIAKEPAEYKYDNIISIDVLIASKTYSSPVGSFGVYSSEQDNENSEYELQEM